MLDANDSKITSNSDSVKFQSPRSERQDRPTPGIYSPDHKNKSGSDAQTI